MAMPNNAYSQYQNSTVNTSTPQELTLMLYNGLVRFIKQSMLAIDEKDVTKAHTFNLKAQAIVFEFMSTLDKKYEVANSFLPLYDFMYRRLIEANIKKDKAMLEEVLGLAEDFRDTWAQAMKLAKQR